MLETNKYNPNTRVRVKETGLNGNAIESSGEVILILLDGEKHHSFFSLKEVEFL